MINYTDFLELILALFILFYVISFFTFYYFFKRLKKFFFNQYIFFESIKGLDKDIKDIKQNIRSLTNDILNIQHYLEKKRGNDKEIFDSLKIDFSKIIEFDEKNSKLLNIINRKMNKSIKE